MSETELSFHKCTDDDYKNFYEPESQSKDMYNKLKQN